MAKSGSDQKKEAPYEMEKAKTAVFFDTSNIDYDLKKTPSRIRQRIKPEVELLTIDLDAMLGIGCDEEEYEEEKLEIVEQKE